MIATGSKFGHYEILASLGAGGMGEVWRARDTRLDRDVAIKLLPAEFAKDADRLHNYITPGGTVLLFPATGNGSWLSHN